jgi:hypothetical protein
VSKQDNNPREGTDPMSTPRNPLSLARRWTAGVLLASTLGAGAVGVSGVSSGTGSAQTGTSGS